MASDIPEDSTRLNLLRCAARVRSMRGESSAPETSTRCSTVFREEEEEKEAKLDEKKLEQVEVKDVEIKLVDKEPPFTFEATVTKDGAMGVTFEPLTAGVMLTQLREGGCMKVYNEQRARDGKEGQVAVHDVIVEVNGKSNREDMVKNLQTDTTLNMKIVRPLAFLVTVTKRSADDSIGLRLDRGERVMEVLGVLESGAAQRYNAGAERQLQVKTGDIIVAVNEVSDSVEKMAQQAQSSRTVAMKLIRFITAPAS
mmetsp:Transcript_39124/g.99964  ORF Transcript_39124/g.99964 Transcript_39124/m.99964 type:complete len:255 (+) Transcript_39124:1308-2072(+)